MPFQTGTNQVFAPSANAGRVLLGVADTMEKIELPKGTTHVSVYADPGAAAYRISYYADPGAAGATPSTPGALLQDQQWHTLPIADIGATLPVFGLAITAANKASHGGTAIVYVQPLTDPVVAALRAWR